MKLVKIFNGMDNDVTLFQHETGYLQRKQYFKVVYGKEVHSKLTYSQACNELGQCIMHSLACAGKIEEISG